MLSLTPLCSRQSWQADEHCELVLGTGFLSHRVYLAAQVVLCVMSRSILGALLTITLVLPISSSHAQPETVVRAVSGMDELPATNLMYVSDYFSFVGQDSQGHVAFAFDNNRGRDGDAYQAEHFLVLHDERQGWITLDANGFFDNTKHELKTIPDSPYFLFQGTPRTGMTITSERNHLTLRIDPLPERTRNRHSGAATWMGSAQATLSWKGRTIAGRVVYEYFMMPEFNRLTRIYWGMWKEFQGLYLMAGQAADVYVHSQLSERLAPLVGRILGFAAFEEQTEAMTDIKVEVLDRDLALGFYRWPTSWRVTWIGSQGPATLTVVQSERTRIANWITGGFSMGIVRGELDYAGKKLPIYGIAELIM